jgi:hypothetical protein
MGFEWSFKGIEGFLRVGRSLRGLDGFGFFEGSAWEGRLFGWGLTRLGRGGDKWLVFIFWICRGVFGNRGFLDGGLEFRIFVEVEGWGRIFRELWDFWEFWMGDR